MDSEKKGQFEAALSACAKIAERQLEAHLDQALAAGTPDRLVAAMRHATLGGGKRFRPFLVMEHARLLGVAAEASVDVAVALEMVHAYSLVHDDLPAMDADEVRRGMPTVWKAFDEWTAILAGDALLTLAFEVVASSGAGRRKPDITVALVREMAAASGAAGMVGGQVLDIEAEKLGLPAKPDVAHVRRLQGLKTGQLIRFACRAGALLGGAAPQALEAATIYGEALGLAFQIADDLIDITGDAEVAGKAVGKDMALGKATLVAVLGEAQARRHLDEAVARAQSALSGFGSEADALRQAALIQLRRQH